MRPQPPASEQPDEKEASLMWDPSNPYNITKNDDDETKTQLLTTGNRS